MHETLQHQQINIPFVLPFAATLADVLLAAHPTNADPFALSRVTVWLPSQRAVKALQEALMAKSQQKGLLLPQLRAMNLGEEDAELLAFEPHLAEGLTKNLALNPVSDVARLLYLARQVQYWQKLTAPDGRHHIGRAYESAVSLKKLSDRMVTYGVSFEALKNIVPSDMATHWEKNIAFLKIVFEHYPQWLKEINAHDPAECRKNLLLAEAEAYTLTPSQGAVYLAGFTDTVPAGIRLMRAILALPHGRIITQGLDVAACRLDLPPTHPQYALKKLLANLGLSAENCHHLPMPDSSKRQARDALITHMMRPQGQTEAWLEEPTPAEAFDGVDYVPAASAHQEADAIALIMRHTLELPNKTAALVTTDRRLATQVADRLNYWGITVNDSAGEGLLRRPAGSFFTLVSAVAAGRFQPLLLAQLFAHPLTYLGQNKSTFKKRAHRFEAHLLRGATPPEGLEGLHARLKEVAMVKELTAEEQQPLLEMLEQLAAAFSPLINCPKMSLKQWVSAHLDVAATLANDDNKTRADSFLAQEDGEALYNNLQNLMHGHGDADPMTLADYHQWLEAFLAQVEVREKYAQHPRLFIWGPLEARLQTADHVIIGGLNEGTWPNALKPDPWLNRDMAAELNLPPASMAVGLNAHDFSALFAAETVTLTRSIKEGGAETLPSRYLLRLEALLQLHGEETLKSFIYNSGYKWLRMAQQWASHLSVPVTPTLPPSAQVPLADVPTVFSASSIKALLTCPYKLYGQKVLGLKPLDPFDQAPDAADKGSLIHAILEAFFVGKNPWGRPVTESTAVPAEKHLIELAEETFATISSPASRALWLTRFRHIAKQFIAQEVENHHQGRTFWLAERKAEMPLYGAGHTATIHATIHARADRIDRTPHGAVLMDYKTGNPPTKAAINKGIDPQLAIEALLLKKGRYFKEGEQTTDLLGVELWKVGGKGDEAYTCAVDYTHGAQNADPDTLVEKAAQGLERLADHYLGQNAPFNAYADLQDQCKYCDFAGICRRHEWQKDTPEEDDTP